jgi:hypothetical protein
MVYTIFLYIMIGGGVWDGGVGGGGGEVGGSKKTKTYPNLCRFWESGLERPLELENFFFLKIRALSSLKPN